MNSKFDDFGGKLDQLFKLVQNQVISRSCAVNGDKNSECTRQSQRRSSIAQSQSLLFDSENEYDNSEGDNIISIQPKADERLNNGSDDEAEVKST